MLYITYRRLDGGFTESTKMCHRFFELRLAEGIFSLEKEKREDYVCIGGNNLRMLLTFGFLCL